jgi:cytochrome P450
VVIMSKVGEGAPATTVQEPTEALFAWFRTMFDTAPVQVDEQQVWQVFDHADVTLILSDPATFSSDTSRFNPAQSDVDLFTKGNIVAMDPPRHRALRSVVSQVFTPRVVAGLAPRIAEVTASLLDAVEGQERFDLVDALAYPLPITVIAELLGVPSEDQARFRSWAEVLFSQQAPDATAMPSPEVIKEMVEAVAPTLREMNAYLLEHVQHRRTRPTDDLIGRLTAAEVDGQRLEDEEIVGFAAVLLLAGHVTTTALLGNAVVTLDANPEAATELRVDPGLLPAAIEEVLRLRSPFPRLGRVTTVDTQIGGRAVPAGHLVIPWVAAANRDPARFPDPGRFDIHRNTTGHLAFGHGIHFCIGAPLARLEGKIALGMLLERYPSLAVDHTTPVEFHNPWVMIAVKRLPVRSIL